MAQPVPSTTYQAAKALAAKQKQLEKEKAGALVGSAGENPLVEEEDEDGDESDSEEGDDEGDWEEREIKAAFESYAEEPPRRHASVDTLSEEDKDLGQVPFASLRPALIQLMNRNIPLDVIFEAMINAGYNNPKSLHVGMDDFRHIYQCVYDTLFPPIDGDEEDDDMELGSQQSGSLGASPLKSLEADEEDEEAFGVGEGRMSRVNASVPVPPVALSSSSQPQPIGKGQGLGQGQGPPRVTKDSSPTKKTTVIAAATSVDSLEREGLKKTSFWETPTGKATGSGTSFSPSVLLPSFPLSPSFPPSPSSLSPFPPSSDWSIIHTYCPSLLCLVHLYYSY